MIIETRPARQAGRVFLSSLENDLRALYTREGIGDRARHNPAQPKRPTGEGDMAMVRSGRSRGSRAFIKTPNRRAVAVAVIGNALEGYDFVVSSFMTVVISTLFFRTPRDYSSILLTTATFGVASGSCP